VLTGGQPCTAATISGNPPSPATPNANAQINATAATCGSARYEFWMLPPGGSYTLVQAFSPSSSYHFDTTQVPAGTYAFTVRVKDASSPRAYDASAAMYYTVLGSARCTAPTLSANATSPKNITTLTQPITFTAGSATCGAPRYQFWMQAPGQAYAIVQDFSASNTYNWNAAAATPGTYWFTVRVKDASSPYPYDVYTAQSFTLNFSQSTPPAGQTLSTGSHTSCAVVSGTVRCWGYNTDGQIGNGTLNSYSVPTQVTGLTGITAVTSGYDHNCALSTGGVVSCWGFNQHGQLGNGTVTSSATPVTVSGLTGATSIAGGAAHTCARLSNSTVRCWGYSSQGAIGNGSLGESSTPVTVTGINNAIAVSAGYYHSCALRSTGQVSCWGGNTAGQLGNGTTTRSLTPVTVTGINTAVAIATQSGTNCALLADKTVKCWGFNLDGELGNGTLSNSSVPTTVVGLTNVSQIGVWNEHACAVSGTSAYCWGNNPYGELGNGSLVYSAVPVGVVGLTGTPVAIAPGWRTTCATLADGTINCWGYGLRGELGNAAKQNSLAPVLVSGIP
jgi:alpha-tubulin suppressor-like RCC1 family protein